MRLAVAWDQPQRAFLCNAHRHELLPEGFLIVVLLVMLLLVENEGGCDAWCR